MLLADNGLDWPYAFIHMSDTMLPAPLSDNRHISAMMDSMHTINVCGQLHQLCMWKLLQHRNSVVFPKRLNRELEAHQFSFQELPLWSATSMDGTIQDIPMVEVVWSDVESETIRPHKCHPLFQPLNPYKTLLLFSTYNYRGP